MIADSGSHKREHLGLDRLAVMQAFLELARDAGRSYLRADQRPEDESSVDILTSAIGIGENEIGEAMIL